MSTELSTLVSHAIAEHDVEHKVFECDPDMADTSAFCEHYGFSLSQSANTILVTSRKLDPPQYALCVVLATTKLDVNKAVCKALGVKKASFASAEQTIDQTGMMIGGVTAFGVGGKIPIFVDRAVMAQTEVVMGGGNRSSKLLLNPRELQKLANVTVIDNLAIPK